MIKSISPFFLLIFYILLGLSTAGCTHKKTEVEFELETFPISQSGWGYKIYKEKRAFIVQHNVPAISEKINFQTEKDAFETGNLMIQKLKQNQMPSITITELDSMEIKYN